MAFFRQGSTGTSVLKPFLLKVREGFLLGLAPDPQKGSPCAECVEFWLQDRKVAVEKMPLSKLTVRRELIPELLLENQSHIFYEIDLDGTYTRFEALVYPHPRCTCEKTNYVAPSEITKRTNFAFSPLTHIKVARFGTPDGNLWLASATGEAPLSGETFTSYGVDRDKEVSRSKAVDAWMKRCVVLDLPRRLARGESVPAEVLQTGNVELITRFLPKQSQFEGMGVGANKEEATLDALFSLAKVRTLKKYSSMMKNPMLVVGANNWMRTKVPFYLLQQYDLHLLFYPNSTQAWVVGLAAFSRQRLEEKPVFAFGAEADINKAIDQVFCKIVEMLRPSEPETEIPRIPNEHPKGHGSKLHMWWTHWIYRCPKISLKDVLHLEAYPRSLEHWRNYFRDGQDLVSVLSVNNHYLPSQIRTLVKLKLSSTDLIQSVPNINGIGTWNDFRDALA